MSNKCKHSVYNCVTTQTYHLLDKTDSYIYDLNGARNPYVLIVHFLPVMHFLPEVYQCQAVGRKQCIDVHLAL